MLPTQAVERTEDESAGAGDVDPSHLRCVEALLFAASEPLDEASLAVRLPAEVPLQAALARLQADYAARGVVLVRIDGRWAFRTAPDLGWLLAAGAGEPRRLSRAALETLAIIAYHQPVTRAEIEEVRGVSLSKGTLDVLLESGWVRLRGRRRVPGRPLTYGTTPAFLDHFGLDGLADLPGAEDLRAAGLLDARVPAGFSVPMPRDDAGLQPDEEPLDPADLSMAFPAPEPDDGA